MNEPALSETPNRASQTVAGKIGYGFLFAVALPLALWLWNSQLRCALPSVQSLWFGTALLTLGCALILLGIWQLWREGRGLPMNAFPPPRLVRGGIYALLPHPIYFGFVAVCAGLALVSGSASALWIITPIAALGCLVLVLGYEKPDLHRRFGPDLATPWLGVPEGEGFLPVSRRIGAALLPLGAWAISYWAVKTLGVSRDAFETRMGWEWSIPILPSTMPVYASIYIVAPLTFLVCSDRAAMRRLITGVWVAIGVNTLFYLVVPATAAFRSVATNDVLSEWLSWEQRMASPAAGSFPSFHVTWAVLCAACLARGPLRRARPLCWFWCLGLCLSSLTTGMHSLADVFAGAAVGAICVRPDKAWSLTLGFTQRLGNAWRAWQFGPLRIMNHSIWAGLAGFAVLLMAGISARQSGLGWVLFIAFSALLGAGLWAQWVEGSSALLRPFGYYGSILGGLLALIVTAIVGGPVAELTAAFALAAPWTQAIGRLRCIVQGCCHGRPVDWGIRVTNPHSRVVKLAGFSGTPIHPTPVYSILANIVLGALLFRFRAAGAGAFMIGGLYLLLSGLARFAEEAYRGEPQTMRFAGLPLYQWMAIGSVVLGMVLMTVPSPALPPMHAPTASLLGIAFFWGLICAFAMSMDFPNSQRRFSRLTG